MYADFGENLKKLRRSMNLTQAQLGDKCGISAAAVSKYESGAFKPSLDVAVEIAQHLNVSLDALLGTGNGISISLHGLNDEQIEFINSVVEQFHMLNMHNKAAMTPSQCEIIVKMIDLFRQ